MKMYSTSGEAVEPLLQRLLQSVHIQPQCSYGIGLKDPGYVSKKHLILKLNRLPRAVHKLLTGEMFAVEKFHLAPVVQYQRDLLHTHRITLLK